MQLQDPLSAFLLMVVVALLPTSHYAAPGRHKSLHSRHLKRVILLIPPMILMLLILPLLIAMEAARM